MVGTPEDFGGLITKRGLPVGKQQICYEVDGYQNRHESGKVFRQKNRSKLPECNDFTMLFRDGNKKIIKLEGVLRTNGSKIL